MGPPMSLPVPWAKTTASGPYFSLDLVHTALAGVVGLVPGDGLEFAFPTRPHPLEGPGDAVGMVHVLGERQDPRAGTPLVEGMVFIPLHLHAGDRL